MSARNVELTSFFRNTTASLHGCRYQLNENGVQQAVAFAAGETDQSKSNLQNIWKLFAQTPGCAREV